MLGIEHLEVARLLLIVMDFYRDDFLGTTLEPVLDLAFDWLWHGDIGVS